MPTYQGQNTTPTGIPLTRLKEIFVATKGFPKTNVSGSFECMKLPLRKEKGAIIKVTSVEVMDVAKGARTQMFNVEITCTCLVSSVPFLSNLLLLSRDAVQVFAATLDATPIYCNFVASAGTFAAPTATDLLSLSCKYTLSQTVREVEIKLVGQLTDTEWNQLNDSTFSASYQAGGSGGATNGLATIATPGVNIRSGFKSCTVNAVNVGELKKDGVELILQTIHDGTEGNKGKQYARSLDLTAKVTSLQANPTNFQGAVDHTQASSYAVVLNDYNDAAWTLTSGARPKIVATTGDEAGSLEITMGGNYVYDFTNSIQLGTPATRTLVQEGL